MPFIVSVIIGVVGVGLTIGCAMMIDERVNQIKILIGRLEARVAELERHAYDANWK